MITVTEVSPSEPLVISGQMQVGEKVPDFCCDGFDWEVSAVLDSIWGNCSNPDCPNYQADIGPTDMYRGVSYTDVGDLAEWLINQRKGNEQWKQNEL